MDRLLHIAAFVIRQMKKYLISTKVFQELLRNLNFCKSLLVALWRYPLDKFSKEI